MMTYGPFYPSVVTGAGWSDLANAQGEPGGDYASAQGTGPELFASSFNANIPSDKQVKKVKVAVLAMAIPVPPTNLCVDCLQLQTDTTEGQPGGTNIGYPALHGRGVDSALDWIEDTIDGLDLAASVVNANDFRVWAAFYDANGLGSDGETRVAGFRIFVEAE